MSEARRKAGEITLAALATLVPLVMWLGFANNVEVPKALVFQALSFFLLVAAITEPVGRARLVGSPLAAPLVVLVVSALVSCAFSGAPGVSWAGEYGSWTGASQTGAVWLGCLAAGAFLVPAAVRRLLNAVLSAVIVMLLYAGIQKAGLDPFPWNPEMKSGYWLFATLGNPVHLGNYLACAFFLTFPAWGGRAAGAWVVRVLLVSAVVAVGERSAFVALAVGAVVEMWRSRTAGGRPGLPAVASAVLAAAAVAAAAAGLAGGEGRVGSMTRLAGARPHILAAAGRLLAERPICGIGSDLLHSRFVSAAGYGYFVAEPPAAAGRDVRLRLPASAHNEPANVAVAQGIVGLGVYLWALVVAVRCSRRSPVLPAIAACFAVHLVNPASAATTVLFWILVATGAVSTSKPEPSRAGAAAERVVGAAMAVFMLAALATSLRVCLGEAHRRETGRLVFFDMLPALSEHLDRWSGYAAAFHPGHAQADAALRRMEWERGRDSAAGEALALLAVARRGNPYSIFYLSAEADLELARGKREGGESSLMRAEELLRRALSMAPAALSLNDDLAACLEARGKRAEAADLRSLRAELDTNGLFAPPR